MEFVQDKITALHDEFGILSTIPNPSDSTLAVEYCLKRSGFVSLSLHHVNGKRMSTLEGSYQEAGSHTGVWEVGGLPSGVYILKLDSRGTNHEQKIQLLK